MTSILFSSQQTRAREVLETIAARLSRTNLQPEGPSWCSGSAGAALFFAEYARLEGAPQHHRFAHDHLESALEALGTVSLPVGLFAGITGVAWTASYLDVTSDTQHVFDAVDEAVLELVRTRPYVAPFDLIEGIAGIASYALERPRDVRARCIVEEVVSRLAETWAAGGGWPKRLAWMPKAARTLHQEGELDLCVAHGAGGVLPVLAAATALGIAPGGRALYLKARDWILSQQLSDPTATFPGVVIAGRERSSSRGAWCYGDPGMAAALHAAGRAMGDHELMDFALETGQRALLRAANNWGVSDIGFCHGASGVAHCYHRLYQASGREPFARAARAWFDVVLRAARAQEPKSLGILTGAAGVGLTLVSALSGTCNGWDRPLGLSTILDPERGEMPERREVA